MNISNKDCIAIYAVLNGANEFDANGDGSLARSLKSEILEIAKVLRDFMIENDLKLENYLYFQYIPESDDCEVRLRDSKQLLKIIEKLNHDFKIEKRWTWGRYLDACNIQKYRSSSRTNVWKNLYMHRVNTIAFEAQMEAVRDLIVLFEKKYGEINCE